MTIPMTNTIMMIKMIIILGSTANDTLVNTMARKVVPHSWWHNHHNDDIIKLSNNDDDDNHDDDDDFYNDQQQENTVVVFRCINVDAVFALVIAAGLKMMMLMIFI